MGKKKEKEIYRKRLNVIELFDRVVLNHLYAAHVIVSFLYFAIVICVSLDCLTMLNCCQQGIPSAAANWAQVQDDVRHGLRLEQSRARRGFRPQRQPFPGDLI